MEIKWLHHGALLALVSSAALAAPEASPGPAAAVNVFIGTGGDGHTFPGAARPFGMVQLSPDTQVRDFHQSYLWAAGYRYEDDTILGFSHTHFSGTGHSDLGDVLLMPYSGKTRLDPGYPERPFSGYRSRFDHKDEHAEPGRPDALSAGLQQRRQPAPERSRLAVDRQCGALDCADGIAAGRGVDGVRRPVGRTRLAARANPEILRHALHAEHAIRRQPGALFRQYADLGHGHREHQRGRSLAAGERQPGRIRRRRQGAVAKRDGGHHGAGAYVQNDGNFVIYAVNTPVWATHTCCH